MGIIRTKKELIKELIQALKENKCRGFEHIVREIVTRKFDKLIFGDKK